MADDPAAPGSPQDEPPHPPPAPRPLDFLVLGTACALCIVVAGALGYLLDSWLHTEPWLSFAGLAFGIISAVLLAIARLRPYL